MKTVLTEQEIEDRIPPYGASVYFAGGSITYHGKYQLPTFARDIERTTLERAYRRAAEVCRETNALFSIPFEAVECCHDAILALLDEAIDAKPTTEALDAYVAEKLAAHEAVIQQMTRGLSWDLDEQAVEFVSYYINADDERLTPITLRVGSVRNDDGSVQHGLLLLDTEYPEEGAHLLVESPSIQPTTEALDAYTKPLRDALKVADERLELCKVWTHPKIHQKYCVPEIEATRAKIKEVLK